MCGIKMGLELVVAYFLDLMVGDPMWFPHPVVGMGKAITFLERKLTENPFCHKRSAHKRIAGASLTIIVVAGSFLLAWFIIRIAYKVHPVIGTVITVWLAFTTLSIRGLHQAASQVRRVLDSKNLNLARKKLGAVVGRNTQHLKRREIIRGAVETVGENTVDGVIAPLFYLFLGGVPLAIVYKAINTLDSMIGYRNDHYKDLGWASARLDDIANYIPARFGGLLIWLSACLLGKGVRGAFKVMLRDGRKNPSPNAGWPQAAVAGALGIKLGGVNYYRGKRVLKPYIGNFKVRLCPAHISQAVGLMYLASLLALILGVSVRWFCL
jgi:adenosylcobinamide-phosphate synthase